MGAQVAGSGVGCLRSYELIEVRSRDRWTLGGSRSGTLIPFLLENARIGKVVLGGLDDQLARGTYALQGAILPDLVEYLQGDEKTQCLAILQKYALTQYDPPHGPKEQALVNGCLDGIGTAISKTEAALREYDSAMVESLKRCFAGTFPQVPEPGFTPAIQYSNGRDKSKYLNFR